MSDENKNKSRDFSDRCLSAVRVFESLAADFVSNRSFRMKRTPFTDHPIIVFFPPITRASSLHKHAKHLRSNPPQHTYFSITENDGDDVRGGDELSEQNELSFFLIFEPLDIPLFTDKNPVLTSSGIFTNHF